MTLKRKGVDFKRSLPEVVVPSNGTQPSARLRKDGELPCKVVIISTHTLPRHPKGFPIVKSLKTLNTKWSTKVYSERCGCIRKPYEVKTERGNILVVQISMKPSSGLYRSSMIELQSTPMCRSPPQCSQTSIWPVVRPTPNIWLGQINKYTQGLTLAKARVEIERNDRKPEDWR